MSIREHWPFNNLGTVTLYRPVGDEELKRISESGFRHFPPRLPSQPIFYPVANAEYASQIARDWNASAGRHGYVTEFRVRRRHLGRYAIHCVGGRIHQEYWIPAEELPEFNKNIVGKIEVIADYAPDDTHSAPHC